MLMIPMMRGDCKFGAHAFVFIYGPRQKALDAALAELGANARAVKGSVSDEADLDRFYAAVKAERGSLDIFLGSGRFDHPDRIERRHHGRSGLHGLQRKEGGRAQSRAHLGGGSEGYR